MLLLQRQEEWCRPKLWCKLDGCANRKKGEKKKRKMMEAGCYQTSLAVSFDFDLTVIVSQSIEPGINRQWDQIGSSRDPFFLLFCSHFFWWGIRVDEAIEHIRAGNVHMNFSADTDGEWAVSNRIVVRNQRCCQLKMTETTVWGDIQLAERCAICS